MTSLGFQTPNALDQQLAQGGTSSVSTPQSMIGTLGGLMQIQSAQQRIPLEQLQLNEAKLKYGDMQDQQNALLQNQTTNPTTGQVTPNVAGAYNQLVQSNPRAAMNLQANVAAQQEKQAELVKTQAGNAQAQLTYLQAASGGIHDQNTLNQAIQNYAKTGGDVSQLPTNWSDPATQAYYGNVYNSTVTAQNNIEDGLKKQNLVLDQSKFGQQQLSEARGTASQLQEQYQSNPQTKEFSGILNAASQGYTAYGLRQQAVATGKSDQEIGAYDSSLGMAFLRMENPSIGPKASTQELLTASASIPSQFRSAVMGAINGQKFSDPMAQSITDFMSNRVENSRMVQAKLDGSYQARATSLGIPAGMAGLSGSQVLSNPLVSENPFDGDSSIAKAMAKRNAAPLAAGGTAQPPTGRPPAPSDPNAAPNVMPDALPQQSETSKQFSSPDQVVANSTPGVVKPGSVMPVTNADAAAQGKAPALPTLSSTEIAKTTAYAKAHGVPLDQAISAVQARKAAKLSEGQ